MDDADFLSTDILGMDEYAQHIMLPPPPLVDFDLINLDFDLAVQTTENYTKSPAFDFNNLPTATDAIPIPANTSIFDHTIFDTTIFDSFDYRMTTSLDSTSSTTHQPINASISSLDTVTATSHLSATTLADYNVIPDMAVMVPQVSSTHSVSFRTLEDPASSRFAQINEETMADLDLALPHAQELVRIAQGESTPDSNNLHRLLTSTHVLANAFDNASAILRRRANRANPRAYILHMPLVAIMEVIIILAYSAPPDVRRWNESNLGWLSLYWSCTDVRAFMKANSQFWSITSTQLPYAHVQLRPLAKARALELEISRRIPAMPASLSHGSSADTRRLTTLLRTTPAHRFASVACTDLRLCPSVVLKWLATTGAKSPRGLQRLTQLELEAPATFDIKDDKDVDKYIKRSFHNFPLYTPNMRLFKSRNVCYPFKSSSLRIFDLAFDTTALATECPRPTLSNILGLIARSNQCIREINLYDAIDDEDEDQIAGPIHLPQIQRLTIAQKDCDIVQLCLSRLITPPECNVHVEVAFGPSASIVSQMKDLFYRMLDKQPSFQNRLLRVRFLGTRHNYARTEIAWMIDSDDKYRIGDCPQYTRSIELKTPINVSWVSCLHAFANALVMLQHPPLKTLVLPASQKAWEVKSFHELEADIVRTLFTIGSVNYVWPPARVSWALGTTRAWDIPKQYPTLLNIPFGRFVDEMRLVRTFDMSRLN